jgi:hypothetical protein
VRDLQVYAADTMVQTALDRHEWSGRLAPDSATPTLAVAFSDVTGIKASQHVQPHLQLTIDPASGGRRQWTLRITLQHTGTNDEDPFYAGAMHWWSEVTLPAGSQWLSSNPASAPDSELPNGGSYALDLYPQETKSTTVIFSMPDQDELLIRRQPGLTPAGLAVIEPGCQESFTTTLTREVTVNLSTLCG